MAGLNIADVFIIITIVISTAVGIYRGFIRELLTLVTWIIAGILAYMYGKVVGQYIFFLDNDTFKEIAGMLAVFIAVVCLGLLIKLIVVKAAKISGASTVDRITGAFFGVLRGCLIVVLLLLVSASNITSEDWYKKSRLVPKFAKVAAMISNGTPKTWKADIQNEVNKVMTAEQPPAPVAPAAATTTTDKTTKN